MKYKLFYEKPCAKLFLMHIIFESMENWIFFSHDGGSCDNKFDFRLFTISANIQYKQQLRHKNFYPYQIILLKRKNLLNSNDNSIIFYANFLLFFKSYMINGGRECLNFKCDLVELKVICWEDKMRSRKFNRKFAFFFILLFWMGKIFSCVKFFIFSYFSSYCMIIKSLFLFGINRLTLLNFQVFISLQLTNNSDFFSIEIEVFFW